MRRNRTKTSTGDLISTLAFLGSGLWLCDAAIQSVGVAAAALWLCGGSCLLAALRHPIAQLLGSRD